MYSRIKNPQTNRFVNTNSTLGKRIINNYLNQVGKSSQSGGNLVGGMFNQSTNKKNAVTKKFNQGGGANCTSCNARKCSQFDSDSCEDGCEKGDQDDDFCYIDDNWCNKNCPGWTL